MSSTNRFIHIAANLYQLLIIIYPASFRREFGPEMVVIFRDVSCAERDKKGAAALIGLWIALFFDLIATAVIERIREVYAMSTSNFGRLAGLGGILAGLLWLGIIVIQIVLDKDSVEDLIAVVPPVLMLLVTLALYLQFEHNISGVLGLAVFAFGTVLLLLAMFGYVLDVEVEGVIGAVGAFTINFFGYSIQGLGLLITAIAFRSRGYFKPWSTILIPLGAFVMANWPIGFAIAFLLSLSEQHTGIMWAADWVVSGIAWIILGAMVLVGDQQPAEQPLKKPA